jgi:predicted hotdog family 3-hydroxylacyl-ACP dehydratase
LTASFPAADNRVITDEELLGLLPHKGKMLLISRVMEYNVHERSLCSEYDVTRNCLFYDPGLSGVPGWMSFEFMAQAVSALSGITGKVLGKPPMLGFILSVSSFEITISLLEPGDIAHVRVTEEMRVGAVSTFSCTVSRGGREAARAKLMVMDVEDPAEFLQKDQYGK